MLDVELASDFLAAIRPATTVVFVGDIDCIVDDQLWTPGVWEGDAGLYKWGPPPPPSFLAPEDLAGLMAGAHGSA